MSLLDIIKPTLSEFHTNKLKLIEHFDYSKIIKQVNKDFNGCLTTAYVTEGIENLKKYYAVALLDPLNEHAVSRYVDPFWHAHIIHTEDYITFCNSVFEQYIQHEPLDEENEAHVTHITGLYDYTVQVYEQLFDNIDVNWWPKRKEAFHIKGPIVCRHMLIENSVIRTNALFPIHSTAIN